jgi:hypothetical protein
MINLNKIYLINNFLILNKEKKTFKISKMYIYIYIKYFFKRCFTVSKFESLFLQSRKTGALLSK